MTITKKGIRLIYVDDESSALYNCQYTLKDFPNIETAEFFQTPCDAIEYVENNPIDFAFLDIDLPQMNGFQLAERLKKICPSMEFAFVTGNVAYMNMSNRVVKAPYIFKPYADEDVYSVLERAF